MFPDTNAPMYPELKMIADLQERCQKLEATCKGLEARLTLLEQGKQSNNILHKIRNY